MHFLYLTVDFGGRDQYHLYLLSTTTRVETKIVFSFSQKSEMLFSWKLYKYFGFRENFPTFTAEKFNDDITFYKTCEI